MIRVTRDAGTKCRFVSRWYKLPYLHMPFAHAAAAASGGMARTEGHIER